MASTSMKPNRRFAIPNSDDDLIINSVYYKVENGEMEESEIMSAFAEMDRRLEEDPNDVFCLYDNFDAFFSLLKFNSKCEQWTLRLNAGQLILEVLNRLSASQYGEVARAVYDVLHSDGRPSPEIFKRCDDTADVLLMAIYLLHKLTNHWESEFQRREKSIAKKGRRQVERDDDMNAWLSLRSKMLSMFTRLCDLSSSDREGKIRKAALRYLWRPPEVDKDLLKALVEVSFKFFDNPDTVRATSRQWLIEIFKMLRVICINFDFFSRLGGILVEKTIHLDYLKEATVTTYPFIDAIIGAAHSSKDGDSDMDPLLSYMIQYIGSLGEIDFSAFSPKPYGLLMLTMAERAPHIMVTHLMAVAVYLNKDPPNLRSYILSTFSELLMSSVLTDEQCRQFNRLNTARERMLDRLMDHLADNNATVRAKVVNLWCKLAEQKRIPLRRLNMGLVSRIGTRLLDKSVNVRKASVHFMSVFLTCNPYGHDFSYDLHKNKLECHLKEREELLKENFDEFDGVEGADLLFMKHADAINENLAKYIPRFRGNDPPYMDIPEGETIEMLVARGVQNLLKKTSKSVKFFVQLYHTGQLAEVMDDIPGVSADDAQPNDDMTDEEYGEVLFKVMKRKFIMDRAEEERDRGDEYDLQREEKMDDHKRKIAKLDGEIEFLKNKLVVELELEDCIPLALRAVLRGELSEMKEGMKFVVECKNFMIRGADKAVRSMCTLIWKPQEDVKKELLEAASRMFISTHSNPEVRDQSTAENLISVIEGMSDNERGCVEEVICQMVSGSFPDGVVKYIWKKLNTSTGKQQLVSLKLLSILARADRALMRPRLRSFQKIVREEANPSIIRAEALAAIANLATERKNTTSMEPVFRVPPSDSLFTTIEEFVKKELFSSTSQSLWCPVVQNALTVYFDIAKETSLGVGRLFSKVVGCCQRVTELVLFIDREIEVLGSVSDEEPCEERQKLVDKKKHFLDVWERVMERVMFLCGEVALRCVVHADVTYIREVKRLPEIMKLVKKGDLIPQEAFSRPLKEFEYKSAMRKGLFDYSEDGPDMQGATDEERVRTRSDQILDTRLMKQKKMLARLLPFVIYSMRSPTSTPGVCCAASLAFSKFMLVSKEISERGAGMFFSFLSNAPWPAVRNNLMVAVGDLCFRAPNMVEKYSHDVFMMSRDPDSRVRETAILVLTHLTTNQMLKTRSSMAEVARCYLDPTPSIQTLTREFFTELAARGSIVYNMMPDFISRLSRDNRDVPLSAFKLILEFLISLLKEKHMDNLLEKLCHRFDLAKGGHHIEKNKNLFYYFSFCVSRLPMTDKSFYKCRDALPHYSQFMTDEVVYNDFLASLTPLLKNTKNHDVKADAEEFGELLLSLHEKGLTHEDMGAAKRMNEKKVARNAARRAVRGGAGRRKKANLSMIEEDSD